MKREKHIVAAWAVLACLLPSVFTGCGKDVPDTDGKLSVPVLLSVGELSGGAGTKMTDKIVQNDDPRTFRGINNFYVVPFSIPKETTSNITREVIQASDPCFDENIQMTGNLKETSFDGTAASKGFFSPGSFVYPLTNTVLAYGQATAEISETVKAGSVAYKQRNGVIVPNDVVTNRTGARAGDIAFDLESILNNPADYNQWESANLAMLNAIANVSLDGGAQFKDPASYAHDEFLTAAFSAFSGNIFSVASEGAVLTRLYNACKAVPASADAPAARSLADKVCETIDNYATADNPMLAVSGPGTDGKYTVTLLRGACSEIGLPDGAVALQWGEWKVGTSGGGFGSPDKSEGVNLAAKADYCFPPALWYFVNSPLLGSSAGGLESQFNDKTRYPRWSDILAAMQGDEQIYTRGVSLDTKAAIVRDPLQYAVALLSLKINGPAAADATELADDAGKKISVAGAVFPLTGVIIGGQRTQNFDFTASSNDMRFVFDVDVNDERTGAPKAWISSSETSAPVYTLAFPTREGEDIYFALEFRNDSGQPFKGVRGTDILPGAKFYLLGEMEYKTGTASGAAKPAAVFVKDHITTLSVSFASLAAAYSILPELTSPDLQMGVSTRLNWNVVPSSYELR